MNGYSSGHPKDRETKLWTKIRSRGAEAVIARSDKRRNNLCFQAKMASLRSQ